MDTRLLDGTAGKQEQERRNIYFRVHDTLQKGFVARWRDEPGQDGAPRRSLLNVSEV
jgi:hypothetical protein